MRLFIALGKLVPTSQPPDLPAGSNNITSPGEALKYWENCNREQHLDLCLIFQEVQVSHCINITDVSIEALLACCPRINILIFDGCPGVTDRSRQALEEAMLRGGRMKQLSWTVY